jgi:hypothetical protein
MPSAGGLSITLEAAPDCLPAGGPASGDVVARLRNGSILRLIAEFHTLDSSDENVATASRLYGGAAHSISVPAAPGPPAPGPGHSQQEHVAEWEAQQPGAATLTGAFRVVTLFSTHLGTLTPHADVKVV